MPKLTVVNEFIDRETGDRCKAGAIIDRAAQRAKELTEKGLVTAPAREPIKAGPKAEEKE